MRRNFFIFLLCVFIIFSMAGCEKADLPTENPTVENTNSEEKTEPSMSFAEMGALGITFDGTRYQTNAYMDDAGDIYISSSAVAKIFGISPANSFDINGAEYSSIPKTCEAEGFESYKYDDVLNAVYIWSRTFESEEANSSFGSVDDSRIGLYHLGTPSEGTLTYQEFFAILDKAVEAADSSRLDDWKEGSLIEARNSNLEITRYEAALSILYLAAFLGEDYTEFNSDWNSYNDLMGEEVWTEVENVYSDHDVSLLLKNPYPYDLGGFKYADYIYGGWDAGGVAIRYVVGRVSNISGETLFSFDYENNSLHLDESITTRDSMLAIARLLDSTKESKESGMLDISDAAIVNYNESIITPELLDFTKDMAEISDETVPDWHGIVWMATGEYDASDLDTVTFEKMAELWSDWGFDSVRYMLPYQVLFSQDGSKASEIAFSKLDQIIASAMKYKLHINICTMSVPGRWSQTTASYEYAGEFDLFLNPARQKETEQIWYTISSRYADLPNSVLSFTPMWECMNFNLSTGLGVQAYTEQDVANEYMRVIESIQSASPGRYVVCELTAANEAEQIVRESSGIKDIKDNYSNVLLSCNFCENPFVYANMTAVEGEHIDNCNRSMFLSLYPCTYYNVQSFVRDGAPLEINGDLHKSTEIVIYLSNVWNTGKIKFVADGEVIYEEALKNARYTITNPLSRYYQYRESDKNITVTLDKDYSNISIQTEGCNVDWCGMQVVLPDEYSVSKWFAPSTYESFLESGQSDYSLVPYKKSTSTILVSPTNDENQYVLTINDDITYSSDSFWAQSSTETIMEWGEVFSGLGENAMIRIENANFSGEYLSSVAYYDDFYSMCEKYGYSWFSNDFDFNNYAYVQNESALDTFFSGSTNVKYGDGWIRMELFEMYQKHLPVIVIEEKDTAANLFIKIFRLKLLSGRFYLCLS